MPRLAPALALLAPALLAAQGRAPAARAAAAPNGASTAAPAAAGAARDSAARPDTGRAARVGARAGAVRGVEPGRLLLGARTWLGVYGTASLGVDGEMALTRPGRYGPGMISAGAAVDLYRYSDRYGAASWSMNVIPVGAYANYHLVLENRRFDPYVGLGLGYAVVSGSASVGGQSVSGARGSGVFTFGQLGARYFVTPNLAAQAQTGFGIGSLSVGVSWKR
jgi:opacity protein-like surface antigen